MELTDIEVKIEEGWIDEEDAIIAPLEADGYSVLSQRPGEPAGWRIDSDDKRAMAANGRLSEIQTERGNAPWYKFR